MNTTKSEKNQKILAFIGLIVTTVIWGSAFIVMKSSVDVISPTYLMAFRFTIAGIGLALVFFKRIGQIRKADILPGIIIGFWLSLSFILQTYGLKYTTVSNNAFITTLYVIMVPFLNLAFHRVKIRKYCLIAAVMAICGIALLSLDGNLTLNIGDGLTLLCSFCYAGHIMFVDYYAKKRDPVILTLLQFITAAVFCWLLAPILEGGLSREVFTPQFVGGLLYLGLFSTMLCFLLQSIAQKYISPSVTSIVLSLECVFGAFFAVILLNDPVTFKIIGGCAFIFTAVLLSQK